MNDLFNSLKGFKPDKRTFTLIIGGVVAVLLFFFGEFAKENDDTVSVTDTSAYSQKYINKSEKELEGILCKINGAGKVKVLVTLESCYENVYAKAYEQDSDIGDGEENISFKEEYAIVKKGSQNEECLIIKVYEPKVKGVAVVCEGGDKPTVQQAVTKTVCALYDIGTDKVSVEKMN